MRTLRLTSPEMRGQDIHDLQHRLNERLEHYKSRKRLHGDGIYGRDTAHCVAEIAFLLGLQHYDGTPAVIRLIEHPALRNPEELLLARHRQKQREEATAHSHSKGAHGGLEAIVAHAKSYQGVHENPAQSNWGDPFPARWEHNFGVDHGPWCACFYCSMVLLAGGHVWGECGYCPALEGYARAGINGFQEFRANHNEGVAPGWGVLYNWVGGSEPEHIGVVVELHGDHLVACEGNTGGPSPGWGGMVALETRPYSLTVGYIKPRI